MFQKIKYVCIGVCVLGFSSLAFAGDHASASWTLDGQASNIAFGSIKSDSFGEVHSFRNLEGAVLPDGSATVEIALGSVETNIEIRNERMIEHVFQNAPTARLTTQIDMDSMARMDVGGTAVIDVEGTLSFVGTEIDVDLEMFVARLSETSVMATSNDMFFLSTEDAGIDAGVSKLMELAGLPGITRTAPVTIRLIFTAPE